MVLSAAGKAEVCGPTDLSHGASRGTGSLAAGPLGSQQLGSPGGAGRLSSPAAVFQRQRVGPGEGVLLASTDVSWEDSVGSGNWLNSGGVLHCAMQLSCLLCPSLTSKEATERDLVVCFFLSDALRV